MKIMKYSLIFITFLIVVFAISFSFGGGTVQTLNDLRFNKIITAFPKQVTREVKPPLFFWFDFLSDTKWLIILSVFALVDSIFVSIFYGLSQSLSLILFIILQVSVLGSLIVMVVIMIHLYKSNSKKHGGIYTFRKAGKQFKLYLAHLNLEPKSYIKLIQFDTKMTPIGLQSLSEMLNMQSIEDMENIEAEWEYEEKYITKKMEKIKKSKQDDEVKLGKLAHLYFLTLYECAHINPEHCYVEGTDYPINQEELGDILDNNLLYQWQN